MYSVEIPPPVILGEADIELFEEVSVFAHAETARHLDSNVQYDTRKVDSASPMFALFRELFKPARESLKQMYSTAELSHFLFRDTTVAPFGLTANGAPSVWHRDNEGLFAREIVISDAIPTEFLHGTIDIAVDPQRLGLKALFDLITDTVNGHGDSYGALTGDSKLQVSQLLPYHFAVLDRTAIHRAPRSASADFDDRLFAIAQYQVAA